MRSIAVLCAMCIVGVALAALPTGEKVLPTDGTVVTGGSTHIVVRTDGTAFVRVYSRGVRYPRAATGDTVYTIREGDVAPYSSAGGVDSVKVELDDATEAIVTWGSW